MVDFVGRVDGSEHAVTADRPDADAGEATAEEPATPEEAAPALESATGEIPAADVAGAETTPEEPETRPDGTGRPEGEP